MATHRAIEIVSEWEDIRGDGSYGEWSDESAVRTLVTMLDALRDEIRREQDRDTGLLAGSDAYCPNCSCHTARECEQRLCDTRNCPG